MGMCSRMTCSRMVIILVIQLTRLGLMSLDILCWKTRRREAFWLIFLGTFWFLSFYANRKVLDLLLYITTFRVWRFFFFFLCVDSFCRKKKTEVLWCNTCHTWTTCKGHRCFRANKTCEMDLNFRIRLLSHSTGWRPRLQFLILCKCQKPSHNMDIIVHWSSQYPVSRKCCLTKKHNKTWSHNSSNFSTGYTLQ